MCCPCDKRTVSVSGTSRLIREDREGRSSSSRCVAQFRFAPEPCAALVLDPLEPVPYAGALAAGSRAGRFDPTAAMTCSLVSLLRTPPSRRSFIVLRQGQGPGSCGGEG